jgi:hypothetical protein
MAHWSAMCGYRRRVATWNREVQSEFRSKCLQGVSLIYLPPQPRLGKSAVGERRRLLTNGTRLLVTEHLGTPAGSFEL